MSHDGRWSEVEQLFDLAVTLDGPARTAFLNRACTDPGLRRELESLLLADQQATGFLEPPHEAPSPDFRIGPYRLLRKLGEGEISSVHLAVREEAYHQHVAIKLIRPGMDSRQILQRFHQERQILASLNHHHIARLLDGGTTRSGQPYFVMEYVDGQLLDQHCQRHQLSLEQRLELFISVCQAVHFAHRKLVVHRDLKPANILVDAEGAPKLLDFGIAKLLDSDRIGVPIERTATAARLMTPHYASPEQVQGKAVGIASDVYSLGVILYKLVTGRRPYELTSQSLYEIERVICESVPPYPSRVLHELGEGLPRGLDSIVLMAMRKEPERRYVSAAALAEDLRRCLDHRPVLARPDTLGYRASSLVCRNRGMVAAALIGILLLGGTAAAAWQWSGTSNDWAGVLYVCPELPSLNACGEPQTGYPQQSVCSAGNDEYLCVHGTEDSFAVGHWKLVRIDDCLKALGKTCTAEHTSRYTCAGRVDSCGALITGSSRQIICASGGERYQCQQDGWRWRDDLGPCTQRCDPSPQLVMGAPSDAGSRLDADPPRDPRSLYDVWPPSCGRVDLLPNPVAHWKYDDPCGRTTVADSSGNGADGVKLNGVGCTEGRHGSAGSFDGRDDTVVVSDRPMFHFTSAMTAAVWVKPARLDGSQTILNKWYAPDSYMLLLESGRYHFSVGLPGGVDVTVSAPAVVNQWAHVAGVFDGSTISLYVDGILAASATAVGPLQDSDRPIVMGYFPTWNAYAGLIDDVLLYNVALSACEVWQLAQ